MNADGSNLKRLLDLPGWEYGGVSWSRDGKKIAFANDRLGNGDYAIWVMNADGSNRKEITNMPGQDIEPDWHPDGNRMVFANWGIKGGTNNEIYLIDADGQNKQKLADGWSPSWSPDGNRIVFSSDRDGEGDRDIYVIDADGKNLKRLTNSPRWNVCPHWWGTPIAVEPAGKLKSTWGKVKVWLHPQ
jgi:Tol biopolymer transport system component